MICFSPFPRKGRAGPIVVLVRMLQVRKAKWKVMEQQQEQKECTVPHNQDLGSWSRGEESKAHPVSGVAGSRGSNNTL